MCTPVASALLFLVPQGIVLLYASLGLVGRRRPAREWVLPGLLLGAAVCLVRGAGLPPGWHVPVLFGVYVSIVRVFRLGSWIEGVAGASLAFLLTTLADVVLVLPALAAAGVSSYAELAARPCLYVLMASLENCGLMVGALLVASGGPVLIPVRSWLESWSRGGEAGEAWAGREGLTVRALRHDGAGAGGHAGLRGHNPGPQAGGRS